MRRLRHLSRPQIDEGLQDDRSESPDTEAEADDWNTHQGCLPTRRGIHVAANARARAHWPQSGSKV